MRTRVLCTSVAAVAALALVAAGSLRGQKPGGRQTARIVWDPATQVLVQRGGVYGRMVRTAGGEILCSYERASRIWVSRSSDEGRTWTGETLAAEFAFGNAANPEMLVLHNGWILLSYNERPRDGVHPFAIRICFSKDGGLSWEGHKLVYEAGVESGTGCWEPAQIQLPSGEIELFFANEKPFPDTTEQEITLIRSLDNGGSWNTPKRVSLRAGHRDGMPVPLVLGHEGGIAIAIEDNGLAGTFKPAIVWSSVADNWAQPFASGDSSARWSALAVPLADSVYAGAPYLRQFPSGETVLSVQSGEGRASEGTLRYSRMVVYVGDSRARHFQEMSIPFPVDAAASGLWNSLFIKNADTVTAISGSTLNGVAGLWAVDGKLEHGR